MTAGPGRAVRATQLQPGDRVWWGDRTVTVDEVHTTSTLADMAAAVDAMSPAAEDHDGPVGPMVGIVILSDGGDQWASPMWARHVVRIEARAEAPA